MSVEHMSVEQAPVEQAPVEQAPVESVIHDIGYQRYTGPRLGRRYAFTSLLLHGLRTAYGLGRPAKSKIFPWSVATIVAGVAVILAAIRAQTGEVAASYVEYVEDMGMLAVLFVAVVAPELVSRDLRSGVLPLYFTRALRPFDYVLAKTAALVGAVWLLLGAPQLIMFLTGAFDADDLGGLWDEVGDLVPGLLYAGVHAFGYASLALLIAALTGKRAFAAGSVVAVFLMTLPIMGVLSVMPSDAVQKLAGLVTPAGIVQGIGVWLFSPGEPGPEVMDIGGYGALYGLTGLLLVVACVFLLLVRYRKVATR